MEGLIFSDFPLAPSTNEAYANNKSGSGRGRYKTDVYKHFEKSCEYWRLKYRAKLIEIPVFFKDNHFLELTISFNILWKRLLCYSKMLRVWESSSNCTLLCSTCIYYV